MKKILYIAISSEMGGVPKHILEILKRKGSSWIAVAVPNDGITFEEIKQLASTTFSLDMNPYSLNSLWRLRDFVMQNKIEIIHSHGKGAGMYSRPLKILCPWVRVVHTFHGICIDKYNWITKKFYLMIEWFLKYLTDSFICVSESEMEFALLNQMAVRERTYVIYNGVDYERHFKATPVTFTNMEKSEVYMIGCVSRMVAGKGHKCLIDAFEQVLRNYPECILVLVGDGSERKQIEDIILQKDLSDKIILTGIRNDVPELLSAFDLFVSCSEKEGLPYTLIEAMASEIPIVATDVPGNHDIITNGYNGILAQSCNCNDVCAKIVWAIEHPEICQEYACNGTKILKSKYLVEENVNKVLGIYSTIAERSK